MNDALASAIAASGLLAAGDRFLVAISGGPDSLSLLHVLHSQRDEFGLASLTAAHLDHGLRGPGSAADAAFVAAFCLKRSIPCHVSVTDTAMRAKQRKISIQQAAREVRYEFLEATARQVGADKIATAHTQDDHVETILLNILRGTGLDGLRGIPAQRGLFIRPLLKVSRAAVMAYCEANHLTPRVDPSNHETDHYTRNNLRLTLLPQLERDYNPAVRQALLRLSEIAAHDTDYLQEHAEAALLKLIHTAEAERLILDANRLRELHPALLRHVLRAALRRIRGTLEAVSHEHIELLCLAIHGEKRLPFGLTTPLPHCTVRVTQRRVHLQVQKS